MIQAIFMPEKGNSLKKVYFWTVLAGMTYAGSSFLMSMVVSSFMGAAAAGVLAIAVSIGNQLVTVGYYNMRPFQVSDVREKYSFSQYAGFRLQTILLMLAVALVWVLAGGYRGEKMLAILFMAVFKVGESLSDLLEGRYQQKERYDVSCRGVFVKTVLYLLAFFLTLFLTKNLMGAIAAMAIVYLLSIWIIDRVLMPNFGGFSLEFSWKISRALMMECLPVFLNSFFMTYIANASKYAMDRYYENEYLGIFNALYMTAFVVNLFSGFILKPMITPLSLKYDQGDLHGFSEAVCRQGLIIAALTVLCIGGAWLLGLPVLGLLFGLDLTGYKTALCIIVAGGAFTAVYQLLQYVVVIMRHQNGCLLACISTAILTFIFTPVLVRKYGILGGAVGYFFSMAFMSALILIIWLYYMRKERRAKAWQNE